MTFAEAYEKLYPREAEEKKDGVNTSMVDEEHDDKNEDDKNEDDEHEEED